MKKYKFLLTSVILGLGVIVVVVDFLLGIFLFKPDTIYKGVQEYLRKENGNPLYISQPFLNYINNPASINEEGVHEINTMGIRHPQKVEIPKPAGTLRVLFLGGSTTFGEVEKTTDAFPSLLEHTVRDSLKLLSPRFENVECLNAGLGAATSAELLVHYLFKFKLFNQFSMGLIYI